MASKPAATDIAPRAKIQLPANLMQQLSAEAEAIAGKIGSPSGNRIRVTQKKTFRMPSGEESPGPIYGVVVDFLSANYYYTGAFDPNDIQPPECFAINERIADLTPHDKATNKQAASCAVCPQNQFGSSGRGKACSNTRLLAVLPPDATNDSPIMILRVSPTAQRAYDAYVAGVARSLKAPPIAVVTEFSFDPTPDYASLRFNTTDQMTPDLFQLCMARREEAKRILLTPPDVVPLTEVPKANKARRGK